MRTLLLLPLLLVGLTAQATLTLVSRETFQGVGVLDTNNPGNLGVISTAPYASAFYKRAGGPRVTSDTTAASSGWSADFQSSVATRWAKHTVNVYNTAAQTNGLFSCWYFVKSLVPSAGNLVQIVSGYDYNLSGEFGVVTIDPATAHFWVKRGGTGEWVNRDTGITMPLNKWFEMRSVWSRQHPTYGSDYLYTLAFRVAGSSTWTNLIQGGPFTFGERLFEIRSGLPALSGATAFLQGRYGMPSLYTFSDYAADGLAPLPDVVDPVGPITWYVNSASGDDNNDGVTPASAWKSMAKVNSESMNSGFISASSYTNGDTLKVDTSGAIWDFQGGVLNLQTPGLTVRAADGQQWIKCKLYQTLTNASFVKVGGLTYTYSTTDTALNAVVWEDDKWLNHPMGATWASVSASVDSTPGSFWTDGTTMYLHPFGNTDPTIDSKRYERSHYNSTIQLSGDNSRIMDIHAGKTCVAKSVDNDSIGNYCMGTQGSSGGTFAGQSMIKRCYFYYGSKHGLGLVADASNSILTISDTQVEQCSPYYSQSPWVSFMTYATSTNNTHIYTNCTTLAASGLIGSTNGAGFVNPVLLSHNTGSGINYNTFHLQNCNFTNGNVNLGVSTNCIVEGGTYGNFNNYNYYLQLHAARLNSVNNMAGNVAVVKNCIIAPTVAYANGSGFGVLSTVTIEGCTFDSSFIPSTDSPYRSMIMRTGPATLVCRDNVFICKPGQQFTVFGNFRSTDSLLASNNVYSLGSTGTIAWQYADATTNDLTLTAWKAKGFDANTIAIAQQFGPAYRPYTKLYQSTAVPTPGGLDFSYRYFPALTTCGAYEYVTPKPSFLMFHR